MSTQDVADALKRVQARITERAGDYSVFSRLSIVEMCSILHWWLVRDKPDEFTVILDELQHKHSLAVDYLLKELYKELGCACRADLDAHLLCKV